MVPTARSASTIVVLRPDALSAPCTVRRHRAAPWPARLRQVFRCDDERAGPALLLIDLATAAMSLPFPGRLQSSRRGRRGVLRRRYRHATFRHIDAGIRMIGRRHTVETMSTNQPPRNWRNTRQRAALRLSRRQLAAQRRGVEGRDGATFDVDPIHPPACAAQACWRIPSARRTVRDVASTPAAMVGQRSPSAATGSAATVEPMSTPVEEARTSRGPVSGSSRQPDRPPARDRPESLRSWVRQAEIDGGQRPGPDPGQGWDRRVEREVPSCGGTNEILRTARLLRGRARRPPEMTRYIDTHRDRFGVEPICTVLSQGRPVHLLRPQAPGRLGPGVRDAEL